MADNSKDLLHMESASSSFTAIESKLLVCGNNKLKQVPDPKPKPPDGVPLTSPVPKSQVMCKVKDFLGVISEANKRLDNDTKANAKDYDIEVLSGNESEYIEMDLMLGVADLQTPEAVAAAESAIAGNQPVISLAPNESESQSEEDDNDDSSENDDDDNDDRVERTRLEISNDKCLRKPCEEVKLRRPPKIVELP